MHYVELKRASEELTAPGAPFEIESVHAQGRNVRAFKNAPSNVRAFWLASAAHAARDYIVYEGERLTYAEAHAQTAALASWLLRQGVRSGDRVAIAMRNIPEWLIIYWACACIGVASVAFNAWWVNEEMAYAVQDSTPKFIFCDPERLDRFLEKPGTAGDARLVLTRATAQDAAVIPWTETIATPAPMPDAEVDPDADVCILYTSGTTGRPKGAQLTHRSCCNNIMAVLFAAQCQALALKYATGVELSPPANPASLAPSPLFHVAANNCVAWPATALGGKIVLMRKWDAAEALRLVASERITGISGVPTMSRELITHPNFAQTDTSSLLTMGGGGAALQPDLLSKIDTQGRGVRAVTGWGLTETSGIVTSVSGDFFTGKPESAGLIMPDYEVKCVDDAGADLPAGAIGELWVRGAQVIKGYLNRPDATAEAITDGWLRTGDIGYIDADNYVYIIDRKKDLVIRGGENVYCGEVESALYRHPAVAECCVFGVKDERLGEEVAAAILLREGLPVRVEELRAEVCRHIAKYKAPRYIWLLSTPLPRNANGKFLKRELRETLALKDAL